MYLYINTYSTIVFFHKKNIVGGLAQCMSSSTYKYEIFVMRKMKTNKLDASF